MKIRKLVSDILSKVSFLLIKSQSCALDFVNAIESTTLKQKGIDRMLNMRMAFTVCVAFFVLDGAYGRVNKECKKSFDVAANKTQQNSTINGVIADYDEGTIYQGVYVFDAVLTDALLNKKYTKFTVTIDGNKVSVPDDVQTMKGYIYRYDLNISIGYEHPNGMHYVSLDISPNDRKGKEWTGSYQVPGYNYQVVLKLKECKRQGAKIKVTKAEQAGDF